jgi:hypothetical protein
MGRNKKYTTEEEKVMARRKYVSIYYYKNKSKIDAKAKEYYRKRKDGDSLQDNKSLR